MLESLEALRSHCLTGRPICLYDFPEREDETDVLYIGCRVLPQDVDFLRRDVGGPMSVYLKSDFLDRLGITTFREFVETTDAGGTLRKIVSPNQSHDPRFAISVDARSNKTGCSPTESANTVNLLYDLVAAASAFDDATFNEEFSETFISPGHVPLISGAEQLLAQRNGHAELSLTLAQMMELPKVVTAGELIDPLTLESMRRDRAEAFARRQGIPFLTGDDVKGALAS